MWGMVFIAPRALPAFSPWELTLGRYLAYGVIAAIAAAPILPRIARKITRADCLALVTQSCSGNLVYFVFVAFGVQLAGVAPTSLIVGILPITVTMLGRRDHGAVPLSQLIWPLLVVAAGIVFQSYNLFPHVTVERNITLALTTIKKMATAEAKKIAHNVLTLVGLEAKKEAYPEQLSGGQAQRVAIARSLAMAPELMLFDEVTSALDPELTGEVLKVMEDLSKQGMTMVLVTHEMAFARKLADVLVFMHQGKVWEMGPPDELFTNPKTAELAKFVSSEL